MAKPFATQRGRECVCKYLKTVVSSYTYTYYYLAQDEEWERDMMII